MFRVVCCSIAHPKIPRHPSCFIPHISAFLRLSLFYEQRNAGVSAVQVITSGMDSRTWVPDVPETFSSFFSSPPRTTPTTRPLTGIRSTPVRLRWKEDSFATWLNHFLTQVMSPTLASTTAVSTRRSSTPRGKTASTSRLTPPQSQLLRTPTVFGSHRQPSVARSKCQRVCQTHGSAPTCGQAPGN